MNGVAAHAFELDDSGGSTIRAVVIPAVLARDCRSEAPVTVGNSFASVVAGYETGGRPRSGGRDTTATTARLAFHGTCGTLAGCGGRGQAFRFRRSCHARCDHALTSFSLGLWAFIHDGSQAKKVHAGRAAEAGCSRRGWQGRPCSPSKSSTTFWAAFSCRSTRMSASRRSLCERLDED
ncbi:hypothetical protein F2981_19745 (plasmid) [Sinorhizobium meliloti]|nr:hypothetical protein [Sinorhizobium meliloti]